MKAPMMNRFRNPVFDFATRVDARDAAASLNARFGYRASYRRIDSRLWRVEVEGVPFPDATKHLAARGFTGKTYTPLERE